MFGGGGDLECRQKKCERGDQQPDHGAQITSQSRAIKVQRADQNCAAYPAQGGHGPDRAEFLFGVIQDLAPKLRYQTCDHVRQCITPKLLDLTGDIYLEEIRKYNEAKET